MKRNIKPLWIYSTLLLVIAIVLIAVTTWIQAQISITNTKITFDKTAQQNIADLTSKYAEAQKQVASLSGLVTSLQTELDELKLANAEREATEEKIRECYKAYRQKRYSELEELSEGITEEQFEAYVPGFYELLVYAMDR